MDFYNFMMAVPRRVSAPSHGKYFVVVVGILKNWFFRGSVKDARSGGTLTRGGGGRVGGFGRGRGARGGPGVGRHYENGGGETGAGGGEEGEKRRSFDRERGPPFRVSRRGGYGNEEGGGETDQPPRRVYERRSGTGRGFENKREGFGRGNWGKPTEEAPAQLSSMLEFVVAMFFVKICI